jgi:hypothetical protein
MVTPMVLEWVDKEFENLHFGDARLDRRLKLCVSQAASIGESTPDRTRSKADLKATYRLVDNPKVHMEDILAEHNQSTRDRCAAYERVYLVQDTTEFDLTKPQQQVVGAGPLGTDKRPGFFYHPLYAITQAGLPLGTVDQVIWTRDPKSLEVPAAERAAERKRACFEEKESCRWLEMMQSGEQIARSLPDTHFVMVADSEADIGELLCQASELPENFDFIIRQSRQHAITAATDSATGESIAAASVDEALSQAQWRSTRTVSVGGREAPTRPDDQKRARKQARTSREAELRIRAITVTIAGPRRAGGGKLDDVTINVVEALEQNPPEGEEPIRWVLFTTLPIVTTEDLDEVLDGYCLRWAVELYFKTCKSGLKIEDMKYETLERYLVAFSILTVVAWRVEYLKGATRTDPEAPCDKYFTPEQWMAIMIFLHRRPVDPTQPPTMQQFMVSIAQLGGYINKKSQGPPGSKTIWRGMSRFATIVEAYAAFTQMTCGV